MNTFQFSQPVKILVVEDEALIRLDMEETLLARGAHVVLGAGDLKSAKEQLATHNDIDLVFLDIQLPDGSGLELARELHQQKIPVVVTTGYVTNDLANIPFIAKPYKEDDLVSVMRALIAVE
jgi:two-component system, response regulator PdtaR